MVHCLPFRLVCSLALTYAVLGAPTAAPALAQASQAGGVRPMTARDVARVRSVSEAAIHPAGSMIAYTLSVPREPGRDEDGPAWSELHVVAFDGGEDRPFVTGEVNVSHIRWSPDGNHLAYLAKRNGDTSQAIYVIPAAAGESVRLVAHETDIAAFDWRPDGRAIAFVATEPVPADVADLRDKGFKQEVYEEDRQARRVYVVDMPQGAAGPAGEIRVLDGLPGHAWHVAWSPDGGRLLVDLAPTPLIDDRYMARRLHVIDVATGVVVAQIENPGKLGEFRWSPDGRTVALVSATDIHDPREGRLMVAPASGGELRDLLPDFEGHVEQVRFTGNGTIVYLASVGVGSRIGRIRSDGSRHKAIHEGHEPVFASLSLDAKGRRLALIGDSPTRAREVFAMMFEDDADPRRLSDVNPWFAEIRFGRQEIVRWTAKDGLEIEGLLIHPVSRRPGERVPTIVVAHGGPESHYDNGWLTRYSSPGQVAAGLGYAVFYPNYRGSTGRGVAFAKADQGDGAGAEFDDILAGIDALIQRRLSDEKRIGITGGSYGGYFTAWAATKHSRRFAAGVMFVGVSDQLSKTGTSDIPNELELVHWLTNPYKDPELFLDRSPLTHVQNAQTPLLILHGKEDPRVNPGQSMEMYRALKVKGDVPVRLILYPGEGHGNRRAAARYDYNLRMMRWFDHFLKQGRRDLPPWRINYRLEPEVSMTSPGRAIRTESGSR